MLPEGGRDRLAPLFYHPVFADGERRASLGDLGMDEASACHDKHHAALHAQSQSCLSLSFLVLLSHCARIRRVILNKSLKNNQ